MSTATPSQSVAWAAIEHHGKEKRKSAMAWLAKLGYP
jgi:hypothetical protein